MKVCHFTSAHKTTDDRIFLKECVSLAENCFEVYIVGIGTTQELSGVKIIGLDTPKGRLERFLSFGRKIYKTAKNLDCDIYHFHDPELLPYGLKLKKQGKKVIFDSHEDVPAQILDKYWIPKALRKLVSNVYKKYESYVVCKLDAVVTATPHISDCFTRRARKVVTVNNFPNFYDITFCDTPFLKREKIIGYAGGLDEIRGKNVIFSAMQKVDGKLVLAGEHNIKNSDKITCIGMVDKTGVSALYAKSMLGLVLYKPAANHYDAQPAKMFEYMAAGLPVIASNFPLWKEIIEDNQCGICVEPENVEQIAEAINFFLNNPDEAERMGRNGRNAIEEKYNWNTEKVKLFKLYK